MGARLSPKAASVTPICISIPMPLAIMIVHGEADCTTTYANAPKRFTEEEPLLLVDLASREVRLLAENGVKPAASAALAALRADFGKMGIRRSLMGRTKYAD